MGHNFAVGAEGGSSQQLSAEGALKLTVLFANQLSVALAVREI